MPATIFSPGFSPETTSKYFSPAMPTFTGRNCTLLSAPTMNTRAGEIVPAAVINIGNMRGSVFAASICCDAF